nr:hypothetical protein [Tanacetum cinerariifolium]
MVKQTFVIIIHLVYLVLCVSYVYDRFNTIITSLKALDEGFSSKNYVRKFLRDLHPKWKANVTAIKESKDIQKGRIKSITLKAKKDSSDDETSTSRSNDQEYAMAVRNFKKFFRSKGKFVRQPREERESLRQRDKKKGKSDWKCFRCCDPSHLIGDCPKHLATKIKRLSLEVLRAIARMTPKTKPTTKLVSWLNRQT